MKSKPHVPKPLGETRVEEILSDKPPTLHPQDTVQKAGERMREAHAEQWPVTEEKKIVGVVEQPHPDRAVARYGHDPNQTLVAQNMSRDVAYCYEDQTCAEALAAMDARHFQYLPVVDRNLRITGIISREELLAKCVTEAG
jgi:predicted transcriptional regulator